MPALDVVYSASHHLIERPRLDQSPAAVYLARLGKGSQRAQSHAIRVLVDIMAPGADPVAFPWSRIEYAHAQVVRSRLEKRGYAPATANRILAAFRGVLKEAWRLGQMSAEAYQRAADVPPVRGSRLQKGRAVSRFELSRLFGVCDLDTSPAGDRDSALFAILYCGGLRRAEAAALDYADWGMGDGSVRVREGKGGKERLVFLADSGRIRVERFLGIRGRQSGPLFCRVLKGGHLTESRITPSAVRWILHARCDEAGIAPASPHDMRRTCISDLLDAGADISMAQKQAGHASVITTQRYDRRTDARLREAMQALRVP